MNSNTGGADGGATAASKKRSFESLEGDKVGEKMPGVTTGPSSEIHGGTKAITKRRTTKRKQTSNAWYKETQELQKEIDAMEKKMQIKLDEANNQNTELTKRNDDLTKELEQARKKIREHQGNGMEEEHLRIRKIAETERDLAHANEQIFPLKMEIAKHLRDYQNLEPLCEKAEEARERTAKLLCSVQQMVGAMQAEAGVDRSAAIEAMNNAIKALQEELKRNQSEEKAQKDALDNAKKAWNRDQKQSQKLATNTIMMESTLGDLKRVKALTLKIGYPEWSYSNGQVITNLVASNNHTLNYLCLRGTILNDDDAALVAESLRSNTYLTYLRLDGSDITEIGRQALLVAVFNASSLNSCADSNHTCQVMGLGQDGINRFDAATNRAIKIFTLLSTTNQRFFNMDCFNGVSIKLIPNLLSLAQKFTEDIPQIRAAYVKQTGESCSYWKHQIPKGNKPLTSVFELLRGWGVSSLFA